MAIELERQGYLYNLHEPKVAEIFNVHIQTIRLWRRTGVIPAYLYRKLGVGAKAGYQYNEVLLNRWINTAESDRAEEERVMTEAIKNYGIKKPIAVS
jgi:Helix-turn-helix domain